MSMALLLRFRAKGPRFVVAVGLAAILGIISYGAYQRLRTAEVAPTDDAAVANEFIRPGSLIDDDSRTATLTLSWSRAEPLEYYGEGGVITGVFVTPGQQLTSGLPVIRVDGRTVAAVESTVPLYRNLKMGDVGSDVGVVESLLAHFGLLSADGRTKFDTAMSKAVQAYNRFTGYGDSAEFLLSSTVWVKPDSPPVDEVLTALGSRVDGSGDPILYFTPVLSGASIEVDAGQPTIEDFGTRVIQVGESKIAVAPDGTRLLDELSLSTFPGLSPPTFESNSASQDSELPVAMSLETPRTWLTLPVTAVVTGSGGATCVVTRNGTTVISIAGAKPGVVLVDQGEIDSNDVLANPSGARDCG